MLIDTRDLFLWDFNCLEHGGRGGVDVEYVHPTPKARLFDKVVDKRLQARVRLCSFTNMIYIREFRRHRDGICRRR